MIPSFFVENDTLLENIEISTGLKLDDMKWDMILEHITINPEQDFSIRFSLFFNSIMRRCKLPLTFADIHDCMDTPDKPDELVLFILVCHYYYGY